MARGGLPAGKPLRTVRLAFVGDISAVASGQPPEIDDEIGALLGSADLVIGNCESPVVEKPLARLGTALGTHHAMTAGFVEALAERMWVSPQQLVFSLANNHALDQGVQGFEETTAALDRLDIRTIGTVARGPVPLIEAGSLTIGFAAFTQWRNAGAGDFAGRVIMLDEAQADDWQGLRNAKADLICAVPHWDWEFRHRPRVPTRALALELATQGVRLIAGHHAHVIQPVARIGETVCAYGLGDFLGTAWSRQPWTQRIGGILVADIASEGLRRGHFTGFALVPFFRIRSEGRERLLPIHRLDPALRRKVETRLAAVLDTRQ